MFRAMCTVLALAITLTASHAQERLKTTGWGSLSGKVTLEGNLKDLLQEMKNLDNNLMKAMQNHADKGCCLAPAAKPVELKDQRWVIDPETKAVANVVVWIKAPAGTYFPTHKDLQKRNGPVVIDQPHCAFVPRVSAHNPVHYDDTGKLVESGQKLILKNSAVVSHNVRALGHPKYNAGFNDTMLPKTEAAKKFNPQPLPISINCDFHTWMKAQLFVFDHPYYAVTNVKGEFEIPVVPAGAEVAIMAYHEEVGWLLTRDGKAMMIKEGKNKVDFSFEPPPPPK